eukprot:GHVN01038995.1.p1 GENE.GHVN01038995.1~~GHVN01038995.1.p1  ORF type:complete len:784 (+),score=175.43 GHVN01038995.1:159-2510(+)
MWVSTDILKSWLCVFINLDYCLRLTQSMENEIRCDGKTNAEPTLNQRSDGEDDWGQQDGLEAHQSIPSENSNIRAERSISDEANAAAPSGDQVNTAAPVLEVLEEQIPAEVPVPPTDEAVQPAPTSNPPLPPYNGLDPNAVWEVDYRTSWLSFDKRLTPKLENLYAKFREDPSLHRFALTSIPGQTFKYSLDFLLMKQTNTSTQRQRDMRRTPHDVNVTTSGVVPGAERGPQAMWMWVGGQANRHRYSDADAILLERGFESKQLTPVVVNNGLHQVYPMWLVHRDVRMGFFGAVSREPLGVDTTHTASGDEGTAQWQWADSDASASKLLSTSSRQAPPTGQEGRQVDQGYSSSPPASPSASIAQLIDNDEAFSWRGVSAGSWAKLTLSREPPETSETSYKPSLVKCPGFDAVVDDVRGGAGLIEVTHKPPEQTQGEGDGGRCDGDIVNGTNEEHSAGDGCTDRHDGKAGDVRHDGDSLEGISIEMEQTSPVPPAADPQPHSPPSPVSPIPPHSPTSSNSPHSSGVVSVSTFSLERDLTSEECCICLTELTSQEEESQGNGDSQMSGDGEQQQSLGVVSLKTCGHLFHRRCIVRWARRTGKVLCPLCKRVTKTVSVGLCPAGTMTSVLIPKGHLTCDGYESYQTILIVYNVPGGTQSSRHNKPGDHFTGVSRVGFIPATVEGIRAHHLLQRAFALGHVFELMFNNKVNWSQISHKTALTGGPHCKGFPDDTYLERLKQEILRKGIEEQQGEDTARPYQTSFRLVPAVNAFRPDNNGFGSNEVPW